MFDGRWRSTFESGLKPVGDNIRRTGITANQLTSTGLVMAVAASLAIANGWMSAGVLLLFLTAVPDVLDGAVAKASGTASPRGAFFDSVVDRVSDALLLGGVAWYLSTTQPGPHRGAAAGRGRPPRCSCPTSGPRPSRWASTPGAA